MPISGGERRSDRWMSPLGIPFRTLPLTDFDQLTRRDPQNLVQADCLRKYSGANLLYTVTNCKIWKVFVWRWIMFAQIDPSRMIDAHRCYCIQSNNGFEFLSRPKSYWSELLHETVRFILYKEWLSRLKRNPNEKYLTFNATTRSCNRYHINVFFE